MNHIKLFEENWNKNYTDNSWLEYIRSLHNFNVGDIVYVSNPYNLKQDYKEGEECEVLALGGKNGPGYLKIKSKDTGDIQEYHFDRLDTDYEHSSKKYNI